MSDSAERTIRASARRRREARQDGRSPQSSTLVNGVQLFVVAVLIYTLGESLLISLATFTKQSISTARADSLAPEESFRRAFDWGATHLLSWFAVLLIMAIVINVAQLGGLRLLVHRILPDFSRVNPMTGIGRLFAAQNVSAGIQSLLIVIAVLAGIGMFWWSQLPKLLALTEFEGGTIMLGIVRVASSATFLAATILVFFGAIDFALRWWRFERDLMMTPEELKQELRDTQGDPQTKARRANQQLRTEQTQAIR
jgi:flagellar biosynthesis protein FlhB